MLKACFINQPYKKGDRNIRGISTTRDATNRNINAMDETPLQPPAPNVLFEGLQQATIEEQPTVLTKANGLQIPKASFFDLPNEIITQILGEIQEDEELHQLAFLSRRLNLLALSVYLSRRSCGSGPDDRLVLYDYNSLDVLRALDASLFKIHLTRLQYPLNRNKPVDELGIELRGLRELIKNGFSSLRKATISLNNATTVSPQEQLQLAQHVFGRNEREIPTVVGEGLITDFISLLDTIISCGCETFEFLHSGPQTSTSRYDINVAIAEEFRGVGALTSFSSILSFLPVTTKQPPLVIHQTPKNDLTEFYLHSPFAFHPQLSRWVMTTLNRSAITLLSVAQQRSLRDDSWVLILPCLSLPSLISLALDSCSMHLADLLRFLVRHRNVKRLSLGSGFSLAETKMVTLPPSGPQLTLVHFSASLNLFIKFFDLAPSLFTPASLHSLTLLLDIPHGHCFIPGMLNIPLESYTCLLQPIKEVHLALSFRGVPSSWVVASGGAYDANCAHALVTHLDIHLKVYHLSCSLLMKLRELLVRFPALVQVNLSTLAGPSCLTLFQKTGFIEMVHEFCPKIISVQLV